LCVTGWIVLLTSTLAVETPQLVFQTAVVDYVFPSTDSRAELINSREFIPENNVITGIKVFEGEIFLSVPRWKTGVPSTLNKLDLSSGKLVPFPSLAFNEPEVLTYVQSMEIDSKGRMWILDVGRLNFMETDTSLIRNLQPKLLIYDLKRGCVVKKHLFPDEVAPRNSSFLNDLVLDQENGMAFISDTGGNGGIVVYDLESDSSWRFTDESLEGHDAKFTVGGKSFPFKIPVNGIALSPDCKYLYYSTISSPILYRIMTKILRHKKFDEFHDYVDKVGVKGVSDGMTFDSKGRLYFASMEQDAIKVWDSKHEATIEESKVIFSDIDTNVWPDTFAYDNHFLYWTTNRLPYFLHDELDFQSSNANFRVFRIETDAQSYLEAQDIEEDIQLDCVSLE